MIGENSLMNDELLDYGISSTFGKGSDTAGLDVDRQGRQEGNARRRR